MKITSRIHLMNMVGILLFVGLGLAGPVAATTVRVRVSDNGGGRLREKVLVVTKALDIGRVVSRELTGPDGNLQLDLPPGPYEIIATLPYGLWETRVKDVGVGDRPISIEIRLPSRIRGQEIRLDEVELLVTVVDRRGMPMPNVWVIARDLKGKRSSSATVSGPLGRVKVSVPADGAEVSAIFREQSVTEPVNIKTGIPECLDNECILREAERAQKSVQPITLTLPMDR